MAVNVLARSSDYTGKVVQSAKDGKQLGQVVDIVFDSDSKKLAGFVVGDEQKQESSGILFEDIQEIVENTIFVKNENSIKPVDKAFEIEKSNGEQKASFSDTVVVDGSGQQVGTLTDLYFDADTGELEDIEIQDQNNKKQRLSADKIKEIKANKVTVSTQDSQGDQKSQEERKVYKGEAKKQEQGGNQNKKDEGGISEKVQGAAEKVQEKAQQAAKKIAK